MTSIYKEGGWSPKNEVGYNDIIALEKLLVERGINKDHCSVYLCSSLLKIVLEFNLTGVVDINYINKVASTRLELKRNLPPYFKVKGLLLDVSALPYKDVEQLDPLITKFIIDGYNKKVTYDKDSVGIIISITIEQSIAGFFTKRIENDVETVLIRNRVNGGDDFDEFYDLLYKSKELPVRVFTTAYNEAIIDAYNFLDML